MLIRELRIEDYDDMLKVWDDAGLPYKPKGRDSREEIERQLKLATSIFLAAEIDGILVGIVLGTQDGRKGWVNRLAVSPKYQRRGVGAMLVKDLEDRFYKLGIDIVACMVEDWNELSAEIFEKWGYERFEGIIYMTKRKGQNV